MADSPSQARRALFVSPDKGGTKTHVKKKRNKNIVSPTSEGLITPNISPSEGKKVKNIKAPTSEGLTTSNISPSEGNKNKEALTCEEPTTSNNSPSEGKKDKIIKAPTSEELITVNISPSEGNKVKSVEALTCEGPKEKSPPKKGEITKSPENGTTSGDSLNKWKSPPSIINDVAEFVRNCQMRSHLVKKGGILVDEDKRRIIAKKMVSVFVIDRKLNKIVRSTKDNVMKSLTGLGIKYEQIVKGDGFAMWDVLLPSEVECVALTKRDLHTKDFILRVVYLGRRRTRVTVFEIPRYVDGETIGAFLMTFGNIVGVSPDSKRGEWKFELMLDIDAFNSIPNCMDIGDKKQVPIIVSGRKPVCWMCGQTGHLAAICKGKKAPEELVVSTQDSLPLTDSAKKGSIADPPTGAKKNIRSTVGAHLRPPSSKSALPSPKKDTAMFKKPTEEWQTVGKGGRKAHTAVSHVPHRPQPEDTDSPTREAPQSYAESLKNKGRCVSPGKAKFDAARALLERINTRPAEGSAPPTIRPSPKNTSSPTNRKSPSQTCTPKRTQMTHTGTPKTTILKSPPLKKTPLPKTTPTRLPIIQNITPVHADTQPPPLPTHLPMPLPPLPATCPQVTAKRPRSPSVGSDEQPPQKKEYIRIFQKGVHICRVNSELVEKSKLQTQAEKELKILHKFNKVKPENKDVEDPANFPQAQRLLTVIKTGPKTQQVWDMLREANETFSSTPPLASWTHPNITVFTSLCHGRVPVLMHPSLYRATKLTFPRHIGGLSKDGTISTIMGHESLGPAIGVLKHSMFYPKSQHQ